MSAGYFFKYWIRMSGVTLTCMCWAATTQGQIFQTPCEQRLEVAQTLYENGKLYRVIDTLEECFQERGKTGKDILSLSVAAFRFLDKDDQAKDQLLRLYRIDPFYQIDTTIPELRYLDQQLVVYPAYFLEGRVGIYFFNRPLITQEWTADPDINLLSEKFKLEGNDPLGFTASGNIGFSIWKNGPYLNTGLGLSRYSFRYTGTYSNVVNPNGSVDQAEVTFREKHWWWHLPVFVSKHFTTTKSRIIDRFFLPYVYAGFSMDYLQRGSAEWVTPRINYQNFDDGPVILDNVNIGDLRNQFNLSVLAGIGVKVHSRHNYLFFDARYAQTMGNLVKTENRYTNEEVQEQLHYVDNDFRLSSISFTAGFGYFFFRAARK